MIIMNDRKIKLIEEVLRQFSSAFTFRPGMIGTPEEINSFFFLYDRIDFILKYGFSIDSKRLSWVAFLEERGYFKGARDLLVEQIRQEKQEDAYKLLQKLREEYYVWQTSKAESNGNIP